MTECCESPASGSGSPTKYRCPVNGMEYRSVGLKTVLRHVAQPWKRVLEGAAYYFCSDPNCDVVYFGQDDSVISKSELRTTVGIKDKSPDRMICYCFGVTYTTAQKNGVLADYIKDKTRRALCSCETSNPSGRCCLKDFPK